MDKLEKAQSEYTALRDKRETVEKDRLSIEGIIEQLDNKKREAMEATWLKVNVDFGAIFSTLLPSAEAKLQPPEGATFEQGGCGVGEYLQGGRARVGLLYFANLMLTCALMVIRV